MNPAEHIFDGVDWVVLDPPDDPNAELFATHSGEVVFGELRFRCYQLNDGQRVIDADDVAAAFAALTEEDG